MTPARRLTLTVLALLLAALALWVSTRLVWLRADFASSVRGTAEVRLTGGQVSPELTGIALFALAAVAAVVATSGWARRLVGGLVVVVGLAVLWRCVDSLGIDPLPYLRAEAAAGATPAGPPTRTAAPLLAVAGGLLLVGAGVVATWWARVLPRLGARYAAPGAGQDRDTEWWKALDAGEDPTSDPTPR